jgi:tRNA-binding protein
LSAEGPKPRLPEVQAEEFFAVDMRVGRVVAVEDFPEARVPAWKLRVDFGPEVGELRSSAQITHYSRDDLENRLVVGVINLPPRQIGPVRSEVLVLGALDPEKGVVLLRPDEDAELGSRIA